MASKLKRKKRTRSLTYTCQGQRLAETMRTVQKPPQGNRELPRLASAATRRSQGVLGPPISEVLQTLYPESAYPEDTQTLFDHELSGQTQELHGGRLAEKSSGHRHRRRHGNRKGHCSGASVLGYAKQPHGPRMPDAEITPYLKVTLYLVRMTHTNKKKFIRII